MSIEWPTEWSGVFPAATTQFTADQDLHLEATATHFEALIDHGVQGLVVLGILGEGASLDEVEKRDVLQLAVEVADKRVPVLAAVSETSTRQACAFAGVAVEMGCNGLLLPSALGYRATPRESLAHFRQVARATNLPVMIDNNPAAYGVDVTPEMFAELAEEPTLVAIKESADDPRRITDLINLLEDRFLLFSGVDDLALEAAFLGANGWVAGLANAFPAEFLSLWELVSHGHWDEARAYYRWFTPLLHLECPPKLVQYVKFAQAVSGRGSETMRAPRLLLEGEERAHIERVIALAMEDHPSPTGD
jgi:4-hydroxy-tetrahydrodipicolinate synthase